MKTDPLNIIRFPEGGAGGSNTYLLIYEPTKEAVVFDPGYDDDSLLKYLRDNMIDLKKIVLTHGHYDHIGGVQKLRDRTGAEVIIGKKDAEYLTNPELNLSAFFEKPIVLEPADRLVETGDQIEVAPNKYVTVVETPGHSPGSTCYVGNGFIICGDLLFENGIGRTDFPGGNMDDMVKSLKSICTYPKQTMVFPGHGSVTTIGKERKYNPFLQTII